MAAANRSGDPEVNAAKVRKHLRNIKSRMTDKKKYRLHYKDIPVGILVTAHPMEINAWNKNARAFYAHQITLGRDMLPILEWKDVGQNQESLVWRVKFRNNGADKEILVDALNKTAAKREAELMIPVCAVIRGIEQDEDIEGAIEAVRKMNGEEEEKEATDQS